MKKIHRKPRIPALPKMALLGCLLWWMAPLACLDPPAQCDDARPCQAGQRCFKGVCICENGRTRCGEACVLLSIDKTNCGQCGQTCLESQTCVQGTCQCPNAQRECLGQCVDTLINRQHCGRCGLQCGEKEQCAQGQCRNTCPANAPTVCDTRCVDTSRHPSHCGGCNQACSAGQLCFDGKCGCPPGWGQCDNTCADLQSDRNHCGACGKTCNAGEVCANGRCAPSCPQSTPTTCFGGCADTLFSDAHCGGCGHACNADQLCYDGLCQCPPETNACQNQCIDLRTTITDCGACGCTCAPGKVCHTGRCLTACPAATPENCFGGCFDLKTNARHCGKCGTSCTGLQQCVDGKCQCPAGMLLCNGKCTDPNTHPLHCSECNKPCAAGQICSKGKCDTTCPTETPTECYGGCFDLKTSSAHCGRCGRQCLGGKQCENSQCTCPVGKRDCGGLCVDVQTDQLHCGACGNTCPAGERCNNGKCILDCDQLANCGGVCVDPKTDPKHCGDCDNACSGNKQCIQGTCTCGDGRIECSGICLDPQTDENHCGKCDNKCDAGKICVQGTCQVVCTDASLTACSTTCADLKKDVQHCGKCDNACLPGQQCKDGTCACPNGQQACNNRCTNTQVDPEHCGVCGNTCKQGEFCLAGQCRLCSDAAPTACGSTCCTPNQTCCNSSYCADLQSDPQNCNACGMACAAGLVCDKGKCTLCADGQTRPCYTGLSGTRGVGECKDGKETCQNATWGACIGSITPTQEVCDDKDNDCNGQIDETFADKGKACTSGQGECARPGKLICNQAGDGLTCDGIPSNPVPEICDNKDNDCNGQIDDGIKGAACPEQKGVCQGSAQRCVNGQFVACDAQSYGPDYEATETLCDGKDNDCNGQIDENLDRTGPLCANQTGWCAGARKSCQNGAWANCTAQEFGLSYQATETLCDGKDNDCDGSVDEGCTGCLPTQAHLSLTHAQAARWVAFSPDGKEVAAGAFLGRLRIWDTATGMQLQDITTTTGPLGIRYSPFFRELAVSRSDFALYNPATGAILRSVASHTPTQNDVAYSPKGDQAATIGEDKKLIIWNHKTLTAAQTISNLPDIPVSVAWSANASFVAVGFKSPNNKIIIYNPTNGQVIQTLSGHTDTVNRVAFSPDNKYLASTSDDKTVRLWNTQTWQQAWSQTGTNAYVGVAFRWDSLVLAVGQSVNLELRDVANNGALLQSFRAHNGAIADVAWSPVGNMVATSSSFSDVKLWKCP